MTSQKIKSPRPPNAVEIARAARIQDMLEAHRRGLRRLYLGRQRAILNKRAIRSIMENDAREYATRNEYRKQLISELAASSKEKQRRLHAWVKQIEESNKNSEPLAIRLERKYQMKEKNSVPVDERFVQPKLTPAKQEETIRSPSVDTKEKEDSRKPFVRTRGDTKMIKMKVINEYVVNL